MRFRIRRADQIVGTFILLAVGLVVAVLIFIAVNQRWFTHMGRYQSKFSSAQNLAVGTGINMRGFEIGKIDKVSLNDANMVDVEFIIYQDYLSRVTKNSVLDISTSPIGLGSTLLFHRGLSPEIQAEGSFVPFLDTPEGRDLERQGLADIPKKDDAIARIMSGATNLMENLNETTLLINEAMTGKGSGALTEVIVNANLAIIGVTKTLSWIDTNLTPITSGANQMIGTVNGTLPGVMSDLGSAIKKIDGMLDGLSSTVNDLQKISSGINGEVPKLSSLLMETRAAIANAQDVMEGLKNNPLLKGGITNKPSQKALFESMRREDFK